MFNRLLILIAALFFVSACKTDPVPPVVVEDTDYSDCLLTTNSNSLEVLTWNLKFFPATSTAIGEIKNIISNLNPDVIGLQEINSANDFEVLVNKLEGWEGVISNTGNLNLGYLYKSSEIEVVESLSTPLESNSSAFPRPPAVIKLKHAIGEIYIFDLHLKCCGGEENVARRMEAARLLKEYIDINLSNEKVIVLGDYNDEIYSEDGSEVTFDLLKNDPDNYRFADMDIAIDESLGWSYPSWPSHIDHILVTNEFYSNEIITNTLLLDECNDFYFSQVSDHRPVMVSIK